MKRGLRAFVGAVLVIAPILALAQPAVAEPETPAQRCERETQMYNDAWESTWQAANPGRPVSPPPVPYTCYDPGPADQEDGSWQPAPPGEEPGSEESDTPSDGMVREGNPGENVPLTVSPNVNGPIVVPRRNAPMPLPVPTEPAVPAPSEDVPQQETLDEEAARRSLEDVLKECTPDLIPAHGPGASLTPQQRKSYNRLRDNLPAKSARQRIIDGVKRGEYGDRYTNDPEQNWQADHVISLNRLVQIPGFVDLPPQVQAEIADSPDNLRPLFARWNLSKQSKSIKDWEGPKGPTYPEFTEEDRKLLCLYEREAQLGVFRQLADYWFDHAVESVAPALSPPNPPVPPEPGQVEPSISSVPTMPPTSLNELPASTPPELTGQPAPTASPQTEPEIPQQQPEEIPATPVPEVPETQPSPLPTTVEVPPSTAAPVAPSTAPSTQVTTAAPSSSVHDTPPPVPRASNPPSNPPSVSKAPTVESEPEPDEFSTWEKVGVGGLIVAGVVVSAFGAPYIGVPMVLGGALAGA